jgi:hypothetical protein
MRVQRVALIEATRQRPADVDNVGPGEDRTVRARPWPQLPSLSYARTYAGRWGSTWSRGTAGTGSAW